MAAEIGVKDGRIAVVRARARWRAARRVDPPPASWCIRRPSTRNNARCRCARRAGRVLTDPPSQVSKAPCRGTRPLIDSCNACKTVRSRNRSTDAGPVEAACRRLGYHPLMGEVPTPAFGQMPMLQDGPWPASDLNTNIRPGNIGRMVQHGTSGGAQVCPPQGGRRGHPCRGTTNRDVMYEKLMARKPRHSSKPR